jgi:hypothetical protein
MLQRSSLSKSSVGVLGRISAISVLSVRVARVRTKSKASGLKDLLSVDNGVAEGGCSGILGAGELLGTELDDVSVEPDTVELGLSHVASTGDSAAARGSAAEAVEGLGHMPFGGGIEELDDL